MQPNQRGPQNPLGARNVLQGAWPGLSGGAGQPVQDLTFGSLLQSRSFLPSFCMPPPLPDGSPQPPRRPEPGSAKEPHLVLAETPAALPTLVRCGLP